MRRKVYLFPSIQFCSDSSSFFFFKLIKYWEAFLPEAKAIA